MQTQRCESRPRRLKHHAALGAHRHDKTKDDKCIWISSRVTVSERQYTSLSQGRRVLLSAKQFHATPRAPTRLCRIPRKFTCAFALRSEASFPAYQTAKRRLKNWTWHSGVSTRSRTSSPEMALNNPRALFGHQEAPPRIRVLTGPRTKTTHLGETVPHCHKDPGYTPLRSSEAYMCICTPVTSQFVGISRHGKRLETEIGAPKAPPTLELRLRIWLCTLPGRDSDTKIEANRPGSKSRSVSEVLVSAHSSSSTAVLGLWSPLYIFPGVQSGQKGMKRITWHPGCRRKKSLLWPLRSPAGISK